MRLQTTFKVVLNGRGRSLVNTVHTPLIMLRHDDTFKQKRKDKKDMRFRDLFLPKIARSNPEIRKKAVMREDDKGALIKIIQNDADRTVRQAARKRLQRLNS